MSGIAAREIGLSRDDAIAVVDNGPPPPTQPGLGCRRPACSIPRSWGA